MEDPMTATSLATSPTTVLKEICNPQLPMSQSGDAATNTTISDSVDCDNVELAVSIRLGGILPSDEEEDVKTDRPSDEEEDVTTDQSASPLTTTETGTTNAMTENTLDSSLLSQIDTLQQIASMESREYQQGLMENSIDTTRLQDRSLIQISQSLHRFHSVILNLNEENDSQTQEILRLQAQEMESQNKIARLEAVVSKLIAQKQKLRKKNRAEKSVNRRLVEHLQNVSNAQQQEEETIGRLLQHEQNLRERCDSSNFSSDLEGFDTESVYSMASNRSLVTSEPPTVRIHRERNLTWPHSDFGDDDDEEAAKDTTTANAKEAKEGAADQPKSFKDWAKATTTVKTTSTTTATSHNNNDEPSRKVIEGGRSVSTADIWKASMRPSSSPNNNFWNTSSIGSKDHDPLHKVDRSSILDLGEHDDIADVRKRKEEKRQSEKQHGAKKKDNEPAFVHDFKVMFGKSPQKRKSSGEKFELFDLFKKDDVNPKRDSSVRSRKSSPSKTKKRESKTSIALDHAKNDAQEAADKIKSSMKNMGKMFNNFMD
mmetsp:Transcript_2407/g.5561  ORF Transcript_2407/g.5561 Transcript_2407/m.5561 type:complete len:542 (-) Transcript_2407:235-1860(-)